MALASARAELTSNPQHAADLSMRGALRLIKEAEQGNANRTPSRGSRPNSSKPAADKKATSFNALGWWDDDSLKGRQHFLDGVGSRSLSEALPPAWGLKLLKPIESGEPSKAPSTVTELIVLVQAVLTETKESAWFAVLSPREQKAAKRQLFYLEDALPVLQDLRETVAGKLPPVEPSTDAADGLDVPRPLVEMATQRAAARARAKEAA
jgi:hypothetical protein